MITPRQTRLVRVAGLRAFREVIGALSAGSRFAAAASRAVIVPTRGAAGQLQTTLGRQHPAGSLPLLLTRDQLYDTLHARLVDPPRRLSPFERDGLAQAAANHAAGAAPALPFQVRPGLVAEMLRFYDQLRRQSQQVKRFEELILEALGGVQGDRGAERMLLPDTVHRRHVPGIRTARRCHRRLRRTHASRASGPRARPRRRLAHVIVTVPDWIADPAGLFVADFDLLVPASSP